MGVTESSPWRAASRFLSVSRRHYGLPSWVTVVLLSAVLFGTGWSPFNINVLRSVFILNDPMFESKFANLVNPDGSMSPVLQDSLSLGNKTLQPSHERKSSLYKRQRNPSIGQQLEHGNSIVGETKASKPVGLLAIEYVLQNSPDLFQQWTVTMIVGISVFMVADVVADYVWNVNPVYGPNLCCMLGPVCFLSSMFCLVLPTPRGVRYLGISLFSESFITCQKTVTSLDEIVNQGSFTRLVLHVILLWPPLGMKHSTCNSAVSLD